MEPGDDECYPEQFEYDHEMMEMFVGRQTRPGKQMLQDMNLVLYYKLSQLPAVIDHHALIILRMDENGSNLYILYFRDKVGALVDQCKKYFTVHEIVPSGVACHMFIDIDYEMPLCDDIDAYNEHLNYVCDTLKKSGATTYYTYRDTLDKISVHGIYENVFLHNIDNSRESAVAWLLSRLDPGFVKTYGIDRGVYRRNASLRMFRSGKLLKDGTRAFKVSSEKNIPYNRSLLVPVRPPGPDAEYVPVIKSEPRAPGETLEIRTNLVLAVEKLMCRLIGSKYPPNGADVWRIMYDSKRKAANIHIKRLKPFYCPICNREHEKENMSLYIPEMNTQPGTLNCWRAINDSIRGIRVEFDPVSIRLEIIWP